MGVAWCDFLRYSRQGENTHNDGSDDCENADDLVGSTTNEISHITTVFSGVKVERLSQWQSD